MTKISEKSLKNYLRCLDKDYIYSCNYEQEKRDKINHVRIIIELLDGKIENLWREDFVNDVEKYEREKFREYMRSRTPHRIRVTIRNMRKNPEIVKALFEYEKRKKKG